MQEDTIFVIHSEVVCFLSKLRNAQLLTLKPIVDSTNMHVVNNKYMYIDRLGWDSKCSPKIYVPTSSL